jgi:DNA-binding NtrC family response regulator
MTAAVPAGVSVRSAVVASADAALRERLRASLAGMRWQVREASGGAEALAQMEERAPEALVIDNWLPDLEVGEFAGQVRLLFPEVDLLRVDGGPVGGSSRSPRRNELLHALREARENAPPEEATWGAFPAIAGWREGPDAGVAGGADLAAGETVEFALPAVAALAPLAPGAVAIPGMVGRTAVMLELARLMRLVAPRSATVLIEGETGTGKEVVAKAIHALSARSGKPFVVLNCAAIPESLLEAELFGHTRGAFTGAVQSRTGRIEAAHGGTLFLDEIGEMPLPLQAKMLRFLECGEIQRVGDNDTMRVDVRVIAATHQALEERASVGTFRLDLYHRLAVFPIEVPALRDRMDDLPLLAEHFLAELGRESPRKRLSAGAMKVLQGYAWPGNVRELGHVLERAVILCGDAPELTADDIRLRRVTR